MRAGPAALLVLVGASVAGAHIVPVPPSLCRLDPLALSVPAAAISGEAAPAGAADELRIVYDTASSEALFCAAGAADPLGSCGGAAARSFTLGASSGTLRFADAFRARVRAGGDLTVPGTSLEVTLDGAGATLPVSFTTGLAAAGDLVVEGAPIAGFGDLTLVGVIAEGLPPPLAGMPLLLRMSCRASPAPDVDQFALPAHITRLSGSIGRSMARLKATLTAATDAPAWSGRPVLLRLHAGSTTIASADLPAGLEEHGRRWKGMTPDGRTRLSVRQRPGGKYAIDLRLAVAALPTDPLVLVDSTLDAGGVLARGEHLFRARRGTLRR